MNTRRFIRNCFWLMLPAFLLLFLLAAKLPAAFQADIFWQGIPMAISLPESTLRIVVFALPAFMPLQFSTPKHRLGWALYLLGTPLYTASWLALIMAPQSAWSLSAIGFLAPAYTPIIWLVGIGLIGDRLFWPNLPYKPWMYIGLVLVFSGFHIAHSAFVYARLA